MFMWTENLFSQKAPIELEWEGWLLWRRLTMVWALAPMGALFLTSPGPGFHPQPVPSLAGISGMTLILRKEICQLFYTNSQMSNVWRKREASFKKKKEKKPNLLGVQARGCSHWGSAASILYQHEHFTSAICQVSFTAVSGQLFLHWWAPSERNWSAPGEI